MPFYPSYYPQEITLETLAPGAAPARFAKNTLHAYVGADVYAGTRAPGGAVMLRIGTVITRLGS